MMALRTRTDNPEKSLHLKIFNFLTSAKLLSHEVTFTDSGDEDLCSLWGRGHCAFHSTYARVRGEGPGGYRLAGI